MKVTNQIINCNSGISKILLSALLFLSVAGAQKVLAQDTQTAGFDRVKIAKLVQSNTRDYFLSVASENPEVSLKYISKATLQKISEEKFLGFQTALIDKGLDFAALRPLAVKYYENPKDQTPGMYAAIDFSSPSNATAYACGFVVWRLQPGPPRINRVEIAFLPEHVLTMLDRAQFKSWTEKAKCRRAISPSVLPSS
ncbi:MAG: hypothetical protein MK208_00540 [Shimia sp.]|uniref:hypothetical protein n=1 Tax=Shimia sp. TaxID=1954381 RepID=UPI0025DC7339|nr:hypothetical protein [Shimia sp.]MCH2065694.1 hypothetical protein [Shimia sp.]